MTEDEYREYLAENRPDLYESMVDMLRYHAMHYEESHSRYHYEMYELIYQNLTMLIERGFLEGEIPEKLIATEPPD